MKKFVTYLLFFFVLFGSVSPILTAHAQLDIPLDLGRFDAPDDLDVDTSVPKPQYKPRAVDLSPPDSNTTTASARSSQGSASSDEAAGSLDTPPDEIDGATGKQTSTEVPPKPLFSCGFGTDMFNECMAAAGVAMIDVSGTALYISGVFLNTVLQYTVVESNKLYNNLGVKNAWNTLRDLANIFFIFILLAIGFVTILQVSTWNYKTLLRDLIIMALLVNFSFFATGVVIDVSNMAALELYSKLEITDDCTNNAVTAGGKVKCLDAGFTGAFMNQLRISSIFDSEKFAEIEKSKPESFYLDILLIGVFGSLFIFITAFVLLATAFMLLIRVIVLIILLIISPVAFAAFILPSTRRYFKQWIQKLFTNAFFAPIYLLSILLALNVMKDIEKATDESTTFVEALLSGNTSKADIFLNFAIITGFMIASLIIAKQAGAYGGTRIADTGNRWRKAAQGLALRNTLGLGGSILAKSARRLESTPGIGFVARPFTRPLEAIGKYGEKAKFGSEAGYSDALAKSTRTKVERGELIEGAAGPAAGERYRRRLGPGKFMGIKMGTPLASSRQARIELDKKAARRGIPTKGETAEANKLAVLEGRMMSTIGKSVDQALRDPEDHDTLNSMGQIITGNADTDDGVKEEISKLVRIGKRDLQQEKRLAKLIKDNISPKDIGQHADVIEKRGGSISERARLNSDNPDQALIQRGHGLSTRRKARTLKRDGEKYSKIAQSAQNRPRPENEKGYQTRKDVEEIIQEKAQEAQ